MIDTLQKQADEVSKTARENTRFRGLNQADISEKEYHELQTELHKKRDQVNGFEEKVMSLELKADRTALDHKIQLQEKTD